MEALGASPQKMSFSEVYGALQTGVVDGQENTWSNIFGKKFFEVQDGITESNHGVVDYLVVVSNEWWNGLDADFRSEFSQILSEVTLLRNSESVRVNVEAKNAIISGGGTVRQLTPEQRLAWITAMKPVWGKFEADIGANLISAAQANNL